MNNSVGVQILQSLDDLQSVAFDLQLVKSLPPLQQLIQTMVSAQFQQNVHILHIFEKVQELSHIRVLHRAMDFNFTHQLLLCSASLQG